MFSQLHELPSVPKGFYPCIPVLLLVPRPSPLLCCPHHQASLLLPIPHSSPTPCHSSTSSFPPGIVSPWVPWYRSLSSCLTSSCALPAGKQEPTDPAVPLPRLARGWDPRGWEGDDQHHCSGAEAAAAVWQPPHHCALQVKPAWSSWATRSLGDGQDPKVDKLGEAGAGLAPPVLQLFPRVDCPVGKGSRGFPSPPGFSLPVLEREERAPSVR